MLTYSRADKPSLEALRPAAMGERPAARPWLTAVKDAVRLSLENYEKFDIEDGGGESPTTSGCRMTSGQRSGWRTRVLRRVLLTRRRTSQRFRRFTTARPSCASAASAVNIMVHG